MSTYAAPVKDMQFVIKELVGLDQVSAMPECAEVSADLVDAVLAEASRFATAVLDPLNRSGDQEGVRLVDGKVIVPQGFSEAYRQFVAGGWNGLAGETAFGGQGLPHVVAMPVQEMWNSANMAFCLCPMLTSGVLEALRLRGSAAQQKLFLPKLTSGEWCGTMNLTEPQAGSDLSAVRARARPEGDHYRIHGTKIFITWGEHDMAENIIHLVLARLPDAPEGVKGISLFIVPKFLVNGDGSLGARNDAYCVSIEHKLGIHASPTAVMAYGDNGGATGYLIGKANDGLKYMFIMMNAARFAVGLEGLALSERAYQQALAYAKDRVQGRAIEGSAEGVPIVRHPDIRRMLMLMKSQIEAMRALGYTVAAAIDTVIKHPDEAERKKNLAFVELMIPVVKGWLTETGIEVASLGVQIHGGMGYIEETGAAQHLRDARITTIYEGTTGIQANDLLGRKILKDGGATLKAVGEMMQQTLAELDKQPGEEFAAIKAAFARGLGALAEAGTFIATNAAKDLRGSFVGAVPFLKLMGIVAGGWMMARAALAAQAKISSGDTDAFYPAKITTARFYADHVLSAAPGLAYTVRHGAAGALALPEDQF